MNLRLGAAKVLLQYPMPIGEHLVYEPAHQTLRQARVKGQAIDQYDAIRIIGMVLGQIMELSTASGPKMSNIAPPGAFHSEKLTV